MDLGSRDEAMAAERTDEAMSFQSANVSSDWQINSNPAIDVLSSNIWDQSSSSANLGFCDTNAHSNITTSNSFGTSGNWHQMNTMSKPGMFLPTAPMMFPQNLPQFPADSDFLQRAARFSCFSGGSFGNMMNHFNNIQRPQPVFEGYGSKPAPNNQMTNVGESSKGELVTDHRDSEISANEYVVGSQSSAKEVGVSGVESDEPECSGLESSAKGRHSKKRKRSGQDTEIDRTRGTPPRPAEAAIDQTDIEQKGKDQNVTTTPGKPGGKSGKQGSQASDNPKEDYIHVRARRGQATNSHSLAERVRREKISERMKFLQDLVPGCNKVTGKAVMLDEIINYVQSLQRQVEFLSMKLATVNPRLDFNIDGLLAKDTRVGPSSSSLSFPLDMAMPYPPIHPQQPALIQAGLPSLGNSADILRRTINSHLATVSGSFKEPTPQVPNMWDDELHNVIQMGFSGAPINSHDIGGSLTPGRMKSEP